MTKIFEVGNENNSVEGAGMTMADEFVPFVDFEKVDKDSEKAVSSALASSKIKLSDFLNEKHKQHYPLELETSKRKFTIFLKIKKGSDQSYDEDGEIEIKPSITDPDLIISPSKIHCDYGDTVQIEIEYKNKKATSFHLDFYANDDFFDFNGGELKNINCGRININLLEAAVVNSIEYLDKDDDVSIVSGQIVQYVNLPINPKFVDASKGIYENRLSQSIKAIVKFDKPGKHEFKVKLIPGSSNVSYSAGEKNRNANFKYMDEELTLTTEENGELIIDGNQIFVSPAGGDIFELSASDTVGTTVKSSGKIKTERVMNYTEIKMTSLTTTASSLSAFTNEYKKHDVIFNALPSASMPYMENIGEHDGNTFKNHVTTAYQNSQGPNKDPYCVAIAYTDHLAVKDSNMKLDVSNIIVGGSSPINVIVEDRMNNPKALWQGIISGEDWFVSGYFIKNGGNVSKDKITIPKSKCTPKQGIGFPVGFFDNIDVDVSFLPNETGKIVLFVNWVNRMRAGLSFGGTNIVAVCTRAWWTTISSKDQNDVIIHEVGHQLGMTTDGTGKKPDKIQTYYDTSKGHVGNHCHFGISLGQARYDSRADAAKANCVMYGSTNGKKSFCRHCAESIKKVDIKSGI